MSDIRDATIAVLRAEAEERAREVRAAPPRRSAEYHEPTLDERLANIDAMLQQIAADAKRACDLRDERIRSLQKCLYDIESIAIVSLSNRNELDMPRDALERIQKIAGGKA